MDHAKILLDAVINESSLTEVQKQLLKKHFKIDVEVEGTSKLREIGNALDDQCHLVNFKRSNEISRICTPRGLI